MPGIESGSPAFSLRCSLVGDADCCVDMDTCVSSGSLGSIDPVVFVAFLT